MAIPKGFSFKDSIPGALGFLLLALIWYVLMRWLYFKPTKTTANQPASNPELRVP